MRSLVIKMLKGRHPTAIENCVGTGTPDVAFSGGWLELKQAPAWPTRGGALRWEHLTAAQRMWLAEHCAAGGNAGVLLHVAPDDWLLFNGREAAVHLGYSDRNKLIEVAALACIGIPGQGEFLAKFESLC